jgi:hypothetical protein
MRDYMMDGTKIGSVSIPLMRLVDRLVEEQKQYFLDQGAFYNVVSVVRTANKNSSSSKASTTKPAAFGLSDNEDEDNDDGKFGAGNVEVGDVEEVSD